MEAIRAAKLSGFLIAAHVTVTPETNPCDVGELIEFLDKKDVDGFLVTTGGLLAEARDAALETALHHSRSLIRSGRWENLSALLEDSYAVAAPAGQKLPSPGENAFEEGD
jgi:hypothetical protein